MICKQWVTQAAPGIPLDCAVVGSDADHVIVNCMAAGRTEKIGGYGSWVRTSDGTIVKRIAIY